MKIIIVIFRGFRAAVIEADLRAVVCRRADIHAHTRAEIQSTESGEGRWFEWSWRIGWRTRKKVAEKMEVGWKRAVGGKWTAAARRRVRARTCGRARMCARGDEVDAVGFDVSGNTGSVGVVERGFLARIGRDFATNRSHRAVDFFRSPWRRDCERKRVTW